jgi:anaerobic selenocysteine-containing dehydrogenase
MNERSHTTNNHRQGASKLSRRGFLKLAAVGAGLSGCMPVNGKMARLLEASVRPPEEALPGEASWYASTCRQCPAGCGIVVRTINGRAKKIEGNPAHPLNQGKLCSRGQAGLQVLYNPDRLKNAVRQSGGRGTRQFEPIQWEAALDLLEEKLKEVSPERVAFLGGSMPDHLYLLVSRFLEALGAPAPFQFDMHSAFDGRTTAIKVSEELFGTKTLPFYDIANADVVFSFGANFLETWQSPVAYSRGYGVFRQGEPGRRGFMVHFEPRLSATAASADEWVPIRPGSEGLVALALGRVIVERRLGHVGAFTEEESRLYQGLDVEHLSRESDVSVEALERLALILANGDRPVAIPGGAPAGHTNGHSNYLAIQALNLILRRLGQRGGVFLSQPTPVETMPAAPASSSFAAVQDLIRRMYAGQVDVLFVSGSNPVFELPEASGFRASLERVPFVVSFSPFVDETAAQADLILPDHTYLESWGYQVPSPGADRTVVSNQQPVVRPLSDTRPTAEIILSLAASMGGEVAGALPWRSLSLFLEDASGMLFNSSLSAYRASSAGSFWVAWRQHGGWWADRVLQLEPEPVGFPSGPLPVAPPTFEGAEESFPFYLYPYPNLALSDGRGANLPWLQEVPDPMTTARWSSWIEINPQTAASMGVEDNQVVRVVSPHGEIEAIVVVYPGIRPDVIAVPVGQGHSDFGRYARERGANPLTLLAPLVDPESGGLSWGATRVRMEPTGRKVTLARLESLDGKGRETIR